MDSLVKHRGGCHCGVVKFEVEAPAEIEAVECNCSICSKSGFLHLIVPKSQFTLIEGAESLSTYTFNTGIAKEAREHGGVSAVVSWAQKRAWVDYAFNQFQAAGYVISSAYTVVKPDFFVLSGLQGLKKFYLRGTFKGDEVRILTILYDQATENTVEPVVIAMSSAFNAFPTGAQMAGPPPRKTVEYGTGVVVSDDGAIVTDRQVADECIAITIPGYGNADRIAEDKDRDLALLRIYGARGLKPLNINGGATKTALDLSGISDPQNQGGGAAVSSVKAAVAQIGGGSDVALSPVPALGFSGAAALES